MVLINKNCFCFIQTLHWNEYFSLHSHISGKVVDLISLVKNWMHSFIVFMLLKINFTEFSTNFFTISYKFYIIYNICSKIYLSNGNVVSKQEGKVIYCYLFINTYSSRRNWGTNYVLYFPISFTKSHSIASHIALN